MKQKRVRVFRSTFPVGCRTATMTITFFPANRCETHVKWEPTAPGGRAALTAQELDQYRSGRNTLCAEVSRYLGGRVVVVER